VVQTSPPRRFHGPIAVLVFVAIAVMVSLTLTQIIQAGKGATKSLDRFGAVPDFVFFDEAGNAITPAVTNGKYLVWSFAAANDTLLTSVMNQRMREIQTALDEMSDDNVLLFTLVTSPANATQLELSEMARTAGANPKRWRFVSGPAENVNTFIERGLFGSEKGQVLDETQRAKRLVLVDPENEVRGFRDGENPQAAANILLDIGALVREAKVPLPKH